MDYYPEDSQGFAPPPDRRYCLGGRRTRQRIHHKLRRPHRLPSHSRIARERLDAVLVLDSVAVVPGQFPPHIPHTLRRRSTSCGEAVVVPSIDLFEFDPSQRNELAWRTSIMFVAAAVSGVVGGLICEL